EPLHRRRSAEDRLVHDVDAAELVERPRVLVHAQVDDLVRETRIAAVLLDHEERRRLLAAPVAARCLGGVEAVEQPLGERALRAFEGLGDRIDGLGRRSEEHTSELQSLAYLVCRLLLEKKKEKKI